MGECLIFVLCLFDFSFSCTGTAHQKGEDAGVNSFTAWVFMMIAFCFVPAAWISYVVREKENKCKHQQV